MHNKPSRRKFIQASAASVAGAYLLHNGTSTTMAAGYRSALEQPVIGFIGTGIRFHNYLSPAALEYGRCPMLADVDAIQAGRALQVVRNNHAERKLPLDIRAYQDYRRVLDNKDIDAVVIGTADHWHSKIAIESMLAGKDVYCEKPLTLTIREGQQILEVLEKTKRVFQVGTQQRSEFQHRFVKAAAMLRENRIGKVKKITVALGPGKTCDPLPEIKPQRSLDWDMWQGQAAVKPFVQAKSALPSGYGAGFPYGRTHCFFRHFYEYSGGKLTDWGAHHIDIALWGLNKLGDDAGKVKINPILANHPVKLDNKGMPTEFDRFNCAVNFQVNLTFDDGIEMLVCDETEGFENGIMFEGEKGRFFVNRGKLTGKPVEDLKNNPLDEDKMRSLYVSNEVPMGKNERKDGANMKSFFDCVKSRQTPSSDVRSHTRAINVCHAINVALRLGREIEFDTKAENFGDDALANSFVEREQRKGYEIQVS